MSKTWTFHCIAQYNYKLYLNVKISNIKIIEGLKLKNVLEKQTKEVNCHTSP